MILHVKEAMYLHDYVLWVRFNDGMQGEVDLRDELDGEMFEPLRKRRLFRALRVDPVLGTVVWPNDADLAPEFLHEKMKPSVCAGPEWGDASLVVREDPAIYEAKRSAKAGRTAGRRMNPRVTAVFPLTGHRLRLRFQNGEERLFDCRPLLGPGVFRELSDVAYFRRVRVCGGTVCWPHEQDICPDTLYMDSAPVTPRKTTRLRQAKRKGGVGGARRSPVAVEKRPMTVMQKRKKP